MRRFLFFFIFVYLYVLLVFTQCSRSLSFDELVDTPPPPAAETRPTIANITLVNGTPAGGTTTNGKAELTAPNTLVFDSCKDIEQKVKVNTSGSNWTFSLNTEGGAYFEVKREPSNSDELTIKTKHVPPAPVTATITLRGTAPDGTNTVLATVVLQQKALPLSNVEIAEAQGGNGTPTKLNEGNGTTNNTQNSFKKGSVESANSPIKVDTLRIKPTGTTTTDKIYLKLTLTGSNGSTTPATCGTGMDLENYPDNVEVWTASAFSDGWLTVRAVASAPDNTAGTATNGASGTKKEQYIMVEATQNTTSTLRNNGIIELAVGSGSARRVVHKVNVYQFGVATTTAPVTTP